MRVVCRFRDTAATVVDVIVLSNCDFPALGGPTIATSSLRFLGGGVLFELQVAGSLLLLLVDSCCLRHVDWR